VALEMLTGNGSPGGAAAQFVVSIAASTALGLVLGRVMAVLIGHVHEHLTELALTGVLAYGAYLAADAVGASGVIATLAAATVFGATGRGSLTKRTIETIDVVWQWVALLLTAAVFLLIGLSIAPQSLIHAAGTIAWGLVAILLGRAAVVYLLLGGASRLVAWIGGWRADSTASKGLPRIPIPLPWLHVLFWAGLRGAVSVALALSLPSDLPNRDLLQGVTFGIVLFTLLVQGTTATWVVRRSGALVETA
jgi:CPA1 family monovalent cation:H+ antiporter